MITAEEARKFLCYDASTGWLTWRTTRGSRAIAGQRTGSVKRSRGRISCVELMLCGRFYKAHRLIVLMMTGEWPNGVVDHINGDPLDNRYENIRVVAECENHKNTRLPRRNQSGFIGVRWNKASRKYVANISVNGKKLHLGLFNCIEEAVGARRLAEVQYGYHPNHGR